MRKMAPYPGYWKEYHKEDHTGTLIQKQHDRHQKGCIGTSKVANTWRRCLKNNLKAIMEVSNQKY